MDVDTRRMRRRKRARSWVKGIRRRLMRPENLPGWVRVGGLDAGARAVDVVSSFDSLGVRFLVLTAAVILGEETSNGTNGYP